MDASSSSLMSSSFSDEFTYSNMASEDGLARMTTVSLSVVFPIAPFSPISGLLVDGFLAELACDIFWF